MKNIVRAFVIALTLTGAAASAVTPKINAKTITPATKAFPIPMCPPGDPNGCGIANR